MLAYSTSRPHYYIHSGAVSCSLKSILNKHYNILQRLYLLLCQIYSFVFTLNLKEVDGASSQNISTYIPKQQYDKWLELRATKWARTTCLQICKTLGCCNARTSSCSRAVLAMQNLSMFWSFTNVSMFQPSHELISFNTTLSSPVA